MCLKIILSVLKILIMTNLKITVTVTMGYRKLHDTKTTKIIPKSLKRQKIFQIVKE